MVKVPTDALTSEQINFIESQDVNIWIKVAMREDMVDENRERIKDKINEAIAKNDHARDQIKCIETSFTIF